jgi:hypothetical protein
LAVHTNSGEGRIDKRIKNDNTVSKMSRKMGVSIVIN